MAEEFEAAGEPDGNGELVQASRPMDHGEGGVSTGGVSATPGPIDAESDGGMNHEDAGLGSGASGSRVNPGHPESGELQPADSKRPSQPWH